MYQKTILTNRARLITAPLKETRTASLLVMIKVGSRYENAKTAGAAHFIEHLMFKGTKKRPRTLDLSKALDGVGAEFNAFTGKEYTGYYIKSDTRHLSLAIEVLSDMLLHSLLALPEVAREKGVIIEEINMYEDNPLMSIHYLLEELLYGRHPLGANIAGSRESVKALTRRDLVGFKNKFYYGGNVVICLSGNFTERQVAELKAKFRFKTTGAKTQSPKINLVQNRPRVALKFKETEQSQIALGFPAYASADRRLDALQLLAIILGGNMSSRLFLRVRERLGLAYFVRSFIESYEDTGALIIRAGLDKSRIKQALKAIVAELKKITKGVTTGELTRAKEYVFGQTALDLEDTASLSEWYASQELLLGKILTPEQKNKKIAAVTKADIAKVAADVIRLNRANLALIGPFKDKNRFLKLLV